MVIYLVWKPLPLATACYTESDEKPWHNVYHERWWNHEDGMKYTIQIEVLTKYEHWLIGRVVLWMQ